MTHSRHQTCAQPPTGSCPFSGWAPTPCSRTAGWRHTRAAQCATHRLQRSVVGGAVLAGGQAGKQAQAAVSRGVEGRKLRGNFMLERGRAQRMRQGHQASCGVGPCLLLLAAARASAATPSARPPARPSTKNSLQRATHGARTHTPVLLVSGSSVISCVDLPAARSASVNSTSLTPLALADCSAKLMAPCL